MSRLVTLPALATLLLSVLACASAPRVPYLEVGPLEPRRGERVVVDQSILLVDSSASVGEAALFPRTKATARSLVKSMPDGSYQAGAISFGGVRREVHELAALDRGALEGYARGLSHLSEGTPIYAALAEAGQALEGHSDHAAITLVSDGQPTDPFGRDVAPEKSFDAARKLSADYDGKVCIHTVHVGEDASGAAFLQQLSQVTGCGSSRSASQLDSASALHAFQREVYLGAAPARRRRWPAPLRAIATATASPTTATSARARRRVRAWTGAAAG